MTSLMLTIDTLRTARALEAAGLTATQADAITSILADATCLSGRRAPSEQDVRVMVAGGRPVGGVDASFVACLFASQIAFATIVIAILHHAKGG